MAAVAAPTAKIEVFLPSASPMFDMEIFDSDLFDDGDSDPATGWIDISSDVIGGLKISYGIDGNGPADVCASVGVCQFALRNDVGSSGGVQGYYSPRHPSRRTGWSLSLPVKVTLTYNGVGYIKHRGTIVDIDPVPGRYRAQHVMVTSHDAIWQLMEADASLVTVQENKTESELIAHVLASVPATSQPVSSDLETGLDVFPMAFDGIGSTPKALPLIRDCALSSLGLAFVSGAGEFRYITRNTRALSPTLITIADRMTSLDVPTVVERVYSKFRVTVHPKSISATATELLYTLPAGNATLIVPLGQTIEIWCDYTDPNNRDTKIGGSSIVTALVAGTHYAANTLADGSGSNLNSYITATLSGFAAKGVFTLSNSGGSDAYITTLKIIGKAVRDQGAQTLEETVTADYGERVLSIDLPFQNSALVGSDTATYLSAAFSATADAADRVGFIANNDDDLMVFALSVEPGDALVVTETVSGITDLSAIAMGVSLELGGNVLRCSLGLAAYSPWALWQWGISGSSEWGLTTYYGF